ncbi:MAG: hypothetical protein KGI25_10325, partial [Thaumarchaeota archaeon]|nr:hypothetical protein [Nitrososphaerota archaeon]
KQVHHIILDLSAKYRVPTSQFVLMGFSQGGAVSLLAGTTYPDYQGAVVALSTYFPMMDHVNIDINYSNPEILYLHGDSDKVLDVSFARESQKFLTDRAFSSSQTIIKGLGHRVDMKEIENLVIPFILIKASGGWAQKPAYLETVPDETSKVKAEGEEVEEEEEHTETEEEEEEEGEEGHPKKDLETTVD